MKILWVKPGKLLPLNTGGKLRTYNILRQLSTAHQLTYLSYYGGPRDEAYEAEVLTHLPGTVSICTEAPDPTGMGRYLDYLRHFPQLAPYSISEVPTGVDLSKYQYDPSTHPQTPLVVFTGSMDWAANIDGVEFFCKEIWPLVLAKVPRARFRIVGRDPQPRVKALASETVEVTGTVP